MILEIDKSIKSKIYYAGYRLTGKYIQSMNNNYNIWSNIVQPFMERRNESN